MKLINQSEQRNHNKFLILNNIINKEASTRAELASVSSLSKVAVSEIITDLIKEGFVIELGVNPNSSSIGRKGIVLAINPNINHVLTVDLGGTKIGFSIYNLALESIGYKSIPTFSGCDREQFLKLLSDEINGFITENSVARSSIGIVSIATAGIVDHITGDVLGGSPNLPEWANFNLSNELSHQIALPVCIENDVRAALVGELHSGKCKNSRNAMLIGIGTGIGSALVLDGQLIRGNSNAAGEIGYMVLSREHLYTNKESDKGSLESFSSGSGLAERYNKFTNSSLTGHEVFHQAKQDNYLAQTLVNELSDYLSLCIINAISIANPEKIVIYGGITLASEQFLKRTEYIVNQHTLSSMKTNIECSELGNQSPLIGSAIIGFNRLYPLIKLLPKIKL